MSRLVKVYENLNSFKDRHGKTRHYYRVPGRKAIAVKGEFGSHDFDANYEAAKAAATGVILPGEARIVKGTVHDLCAQYYQSYEFKSLRASTQKLYRRQIEIFRAGVGNIMVRAITHVHITKVKDAYADRPGAGRNILKRLQTLFTYAIPAFRSDNPCASVKKPKPGAGFQPWTDEDIEIYENHWGPGTRERLGLYLCLYTTQRRSDIVPMGRQHVKNGEISVWQQKTNSRVWIPLHYKLAEELAHVPANQMLFLVNGKTGKQLSSAGFGNWLREKGKEAGIPGTRGPHGLRKAGCRQLIEFGVDSDTAIGISGHSDPAQLEPYIRDVNMKLKARQAMTKWQEGSRALDAADEQS